MIQKFRDAWSTNYSKSKRRPQKPGAEEQLLTEIRDLLKRPS